MSRSLHVFSHFTPKYKDTPKFAELKHTVERYKYLLEHAVENKYCSFNIQGGPERMQQR